MRSKSQHLSRCMHKMTSRVSLVLIVVAVSLSTASAQWKWGRCNVRPVVDDFNVLLMQGRWYENSYTSNIATMRGGIGRCQYGEYRVHEEGKVSYRQVGIYGDDGDGDANSTSLTTIFEGVATYDEERPTLWQVRENRFTRAMNYWTVDTDYRTFAFVQLCVNRLLFFREEYTWVLTRDRKVPTDSVVYSNIVDRYISSGLDGSTLLYSNQERCPEVDRPNHGGGEETTTDRPREETDDDDEGRDERPIDGDQMSEEN